jgi:hypothetical protein
VPGELWRGAFALGKEATPGTGVAATRLLYLNPDSALTRVRAPRPHRFMTSTRDNLRAFTAGPVEAGGAVHIPLSASELIEWLLLGVRGGVTPTPTVAGTAEVQSLIATGATSGTFTLTFNGQTTAPIAFNATAAAVQAALVALSTIGAGNLVATGGPLPGTAVVLTFGGALQGPQNLITATNTALVGGAAAVTRTTAGTFGAYLWSFTPGPTLDAGTLQWNDGANSWQELGTRVNQIEFAGSVLGDNVVNVDLFGTNLNTLGGGLTAGLASRTPDFFEGWESKLYIDPFGAAPGATVIAGTLINWTVRMVGNLGRKFTADNTLAANSVPFGEIDVTGTLTFEAAAAQSIAEFNAWENGTATPTKRMVRLEFGQNAVLTGVQKSFVQVDLPGSWSAFNFAQNDAGTRTYQLTWQGVYDPTNGFVIQVRAQNSRPTAYV